MSLKVFDLECAQHHVFEGWFRSHDDYETQHAGGLIVCPVCGDAQVVKRLSAPRLNVAHLHPAAVSSPSRDRAPAGGADVGRSSAMAPVPGGASGKGEPMTPERLAALQVEVFKQVKAFVRRAENVGPRFAEEARKMHEGDTDTRAIRGTATRDEQAALAEDGIDIVALPDIFDGDDNLH